MEVRLAIFSLSIRVLKLFNDVNNLHRDGVLEYNKQQLDVQRFQETALLVKEKAIEKTNIQKLLSMSNTEYSANISVKKKGVLHVRPKARNYRLHQKN